jgi:hypothetical protein
MPKIVNLSKLRTPTFVIFGTPVTMAMPDGPYTWVKPHLHDQVTKLGCRVRDLLREKRTPFTEIEVVDPQPETRHHHAWSNPQRTIEECSTRESWITWPAPESCGVGRRS